MADNNSSTSQGPKRKLLENPFISSAIVPLAIVLVGALIIFGVTQMLSSDRSYKDLVRELKSKTLGNRWVSAYELSKLIATENIPKEDIPWLIENLGEVYKSAADEQTKEFVIVALGSLRHEDTVPFLIEALESQHEKITFHALVGLGNLPKDVDVPWHKVVPFLKSHDHALKQAAILTLASHKVKQAEKQIEVLLNDSGSGVRYAAATALIYYQNENALPVIKEILELEISNSTVNGGFDQGQLASLKLNILGAAQKSGWTQLVPLIEKLVEREKDPKVVSNARQVLSQLKK